MKISHEWLQRYFEKELPDAQALADALTFHAFEIESIENDILDVKVTANRGHDCLCHRGIAKELSAILRLPMKSDPLRAVTNLEASPLGSVGVSVDDSNLCPRYIAGYIKGVAVGPSPEWLRKHLESIGQKSINNVVDATNFVMFSIGQPLHAFDVGKLEQKDGTYAIGVRKARTGEQVHALDGIKYELANSMLVITDENGKEPIGIAGVKGGMPASIMTATKDIIVESANFDGVSVRKTAQQLKLRTDASSRFEQVISAELAAYGMHAVTDLILEIAGGELVGFADAYPQVQQQKSVSVEATQINVILGSQLSDADIADALTRLDLPFTMMADAFVVEPPFERLDLLIPEDIAEEVGRIIGYDKIQPAALAPLQKKPEVNKNFYASERMREEYVAQGYSEVFTSVFADTGERVVANKVDGVRPYLRTTLIDGLKDALERNDRNKDLLGLPEVRLFEIGIVWKGGKEMTVLGTADKAGVREEPLPAHKAHAYEALPLSHAQRFHSFSRYPFITRDIALWVSQGTIEQDVLQVIRSNAGELLVRSEKFDEFKKGERTSFAFRLVFQSFDRTLTDLDANERMESISNALKAKGFEIR